MLQSDQSMEQNRTRARVFSIIILGILVILGGRMIQLQVVDAQQYAGTAEAQSIRPTRVIPPRGVIYDRNNILMVDNEASFTLTLTPRYFDTTQYNLLASLMGVEEQVIREAYKKARAWSATRPSAAFREVPFDVFSRVQENMHRLKGIEFEDAWKRRYHTEAHAAHALGYTREINDRELERVREAGYEQGDLFGKSGIERTYESFLRGELGVDFRQVDLRGRVLKAELADQPDIPAQNGYDLILALDSKVQALAESLFVNKRGGAVAIDVNTGGLIAMVSMPDYDPEVFTRKLTPEVWSELQGPTKPMLNRATLNLMPPGSTWKPFMALMGMQAGLVGPTETITCRGGHPLGRGRNLTCMGVHGPQDAEDAIRNSCNTYFFELMYRANIEQFKKYGTMFGFGVEAPTDIPEQSKGLIPDSAYFNNFAGEGKWGPGWTISMGIGQGNMGVTPLQLARYTAAVANEGTLHSPHLVESLRNPQTGETIPAEIPPPQQLDVNPEYYPVVKEGMRRVMVESTGRLSQIPGISAGGKTGTAQAPGINREDDSLFIMFAPFDDPQIAIAVQCENAGYGGSCAAPIASLMAEQYLKGEIPDSREKDIRMRRAMLASSQPLPSAKTD
ncbi:MAG: penicillin-binding protein 2 [Rhodothermales bacterium]